MLLNSRIALTNEHGSWVFLFSPLLVGLFAAGRWSPATGWLILAAVGVFLFRHPLTITVKIYAGRRARHDLGAAWLWMGIYGFLAALGYWRLWALGAGWIAVLAVPGLPVLFWHLYLVTRRAERRQIGLEIIAGGVLALAAPGAYWAGIGAYEADGWWLWVLTWLQTAGSITYAALRLEQRGWKMVPDRSGRFAAARRALLYTSFNLGFAAALGFARIIPSWIWLAFAVQWLESLWGTARPSIGVRPTRIGLRQLAVSIVFTIVFVVVWG